MLDNVVVGRYYPIKSKIHLMNPICKIICLLIYILSLFMASNIYTTIILTIFTLILMYLTNIPSRLYFKTVFSLKYLLLFILVINTICGINILNTIIMITRLSILVIYTTIVTLTTPPTEITYGLEKTFSFLNVFKIPVNKMALSLTLAIRFIPTIIDEANKILKSQASRGIDYYNSNLKGKYVAVKAMLFPMINLTIKKADDLADAMEVRLFSINNKRTNYRINKWNMFDNYILFVHIILFIICLIKGVVL